MFNVGILAGVSKSPVFLNSAQISVSGGIGELNFLPDGTSSPSGRGWYRGGVPDLQDYQFRATMESGLLFFSLSPNVVIDPGVWHRMQAWFRIGADYSEDYAGRVLLEIRESSSLRVVASARYWTSGYAP